MKVFISWSGEPSRTVARDLARWLRMVLQRVEPWMSDEEIQGGSRWSDVLAKELDTTDFGIVCITPSNRNSPWLLFEAGALAKRLEVSRVVPLYIGLSPSDVTGPLSAFQGRTCNAEGVRQLVGDLNAATEGRLSEPQLDGLFSALWPNLDESLSAIEVNTSEASPSRSIEDMISEIVLRVRRLESISQPQASSILEERVLQRLLRGSGSHQMLPPELLNVLEVAIPEPLDLGPRERAMLFRLLSQMTRSGHVHVAADAPTPRQSDPLPDTDSPMDTEP